MVSNYSLLSEEQKEKRRIAYRKWAAKNSRKEYYKEYDKNRTNKKERAEKFNEFRHQNPEYWRQYSNEAYHRNKNNDRPSNKKEYKLWWSAKKRATAKNIPFDIEREDIEITETCPCCNSVMERPSLDRINPSQGYTKGNIKVICVPCNTIKSYGDADYHRMIADYIDKFSSSG